MQGWRGTGETREHKREEMTTQRRRGREGAAETPPPVFRQKRLQAIEKKGRESKKERQETLRGGKLLKDRGVEAERRRGPARFLRDNTRNHTTDLDVCQ